MKKYFVLMTVVLGFLSCDSFLSKNPDNRTDINSKEAVKAMLASAYPDWSYVWFTELMSDNVTDVGPVAPYNDVTTKQSYNWEYVDSETQDTPTGYWNAAYLAIAHANTVIEAIDRMVADGTYAESELAPQRAEALMARAYAHFMLVNLFAEHYDPNTAASTLAIPYVTEVEKVPNVTYTRKTVQEVYDLIEKDIQAAMPFKGESQIKDSEMNNKSWHMNTKAAATFASRFYLWRGLDSDWEKVIYYADIVLGNDPASGLRDWSVTGGDEPMSWDAFSLEYTRSRVAANLQLKECISAGSNDRAALYRYTMSNSMQTEIIGLARNGYDIFPTTSTPTEMSKDTVTVYHYFINMALGYTTYECYFIYKLREQFQRDGVNANYGTPYVMYPLFVAEEALLNKAEALVMQNNFDQANKLLDALFSKRLFAMTPKGEELYSSEKVLKHVLVSDARVKSIYSGTAQHPEVAPHYVGKLTTDQKTYLKCLMRMRRTEFIHEGLRWFDIKRMHIEVKHVNVNGLTNVLTPNDERRVLALPEAALSSGLLVDPNVPEVKKVTAPKQIEPERVFSTEDMAVSNDGKFELK